VGPGLDDHQASLSVGELGFQIGGEFGMMLLPDARQPPGMP
jgi:hypothetical protein